MLSPSPTQPPPPPEQVVPEKPVVHNPSIKKRPGQTPGALLIKRILRLPVKLLYYLITAIRTHKLLSLGIIALLLASISATTYFTTGAFPFGIGSDPFKVPNNTNGAIQNWLYALRDGDTTHMQLLDRNMSQPPDVNQLVTSYSQARTHLTWKEINVIGSHQQADTTVDTIVQVDMSASGPGGASQGMMIWHFVTASSNGHDLLLSATLVDAR